MKDFITGVCGLPRSGTSMMMGCLYHGGYPCAFDHMLSYETERMLALPLEHDWLAGCVGRAVKFLDPLRFTPPDSYRYRFIFMERNADDIRRSQTKMAGLAPKRKEIEKTDRRTRRMLCQYSDFDFLVVQFHSLLIEPRVILNDVSKFLDCPLDTTKAEKSIVERTTGVYEGMLESHLIAEQESQE